MDQEQIARGIISVLTNPGQSNRQGHQRTGQMAAEVIEEEKSKKRRIHVESLTLP
jgi:hypothetical protein